MRVFQTGGTGFIGGHVARLLRERGDEVAVLARSPAKATALADLGCDLVTGDLSDVGAIRRGMEGADAAIHGAAIYEIGVSAARRRQMYEANVTGTENVLGAALDLGVSKVVYVSTGNVYGNTHGEVVDESADRVDPNFVSAYDETKRLAHEVAMGFIERGLPCVIAQPGQVYGPDDHSEIGAAMRRFLRGRLPALPFPGTGLNFVHVVDAAAGILLCLDRGEPGERYNLGGENCTMRRMFETLARVSGRRPPRWNVPTGLIRAVAPLGRAIGPLLGYGPNLREMVSAADGVTYWATDERARRDLGYASRDLETGLRELVATTRA